MIRALPSAVAALLFAAAFSAAAQSNVPAAPPAPPPNRQATLKLSEELRAQCLAGRRSICGKILRIFPNGILVECGYTNLLRPPLTKSWLVPGSVVASRAPALVESKEPGALGLPRGKPRQYDYVVIAGYPAGDFTYTSVGAIRKTVRRFSANLDKAVKANLAPPEQHAAK